MSVIARELLKRQYLGTVDPAVDSNYLIFEIASIFLSQINSEICKDVNSMFSVGLEEDDYFKWRVCFEGPPETPYEGGIFTVLMNFPEDFPNSPPEMVFEQEMWHPNIYPDGKVCISILHPPGSDRYNDQERPEERWRPILGVESILISVISMLGEPNLESPANVDAGVHLKNNPKEYRRKVQMLTRKTLE